MCETTALADLDAEAWVADGGKALFQGANLCVRLLDILPDVRKDSVTAGECYRLVARVESHVRICRGEQSHVGYAKP